MLRPLYPLIILSIVATTAPSEAVASPDDPSPEIAELTRAAEGGDPRAQISLGMRYRDGEGVAKDYQAAMKWYRRCADQGDAEGLDNVGYLYLRGWGVPVNFDIAAAFFKASADEDHAQGLFNLGNCYFSGQGVEQDYANAIAAWKRAAEDDHRAATWRLATLYAAGESVPRDREKAEELCRRIADKDHADAALLLGELLVSRGESKEAHRWWTIAAENGSTQAETLLKLESWRHEDSVTGEYAFVEVDHLFQGWNNCGSTSMAMFARHAKVDTTPYAIKRLCPRSPIGTGTDWADLVAAGNELDQPWKMVTFSNDEGGFAEGVEVIRSHLDAGRPVVIDFTVVRERENGEVERNGHTLLVVGYHAGRDLYVLKNPNQPPPGIEVMTAEELTDNWYSAGYSHLAKGKAARPLIVLAEK